MLEIDNCIKIYFILPTKNIFLFHMVFLLSMLTIIKSNLGSIVLRFDGYEGGKLLFGTLGGTFAGFSRRKNTFCV